MVGTEEWNHFECRIALSQPFAYILCKKFAFVNVWVMIGILLMIMYEETLYSSIVSFLFGCVKWSNYHPKYFRIHSVRWWHTEKMHSHIWLICLLLSFSFPSLQLGFCQKQTPFYVTCYGMRAFINSHTEPMSTYIMNVYALTAERFCHVAQQNFVM